LKKTVYIDPDTNNLCHCEDDFYKTCPLRAASKLDCREAIVAITFIDREAESEQVSESIRSLDPALKNLIDPLRDLVNKIK
jgi:hypothetical protein